MIESMHAPAGNDLDPEISRFIRQIAADAAEFPDFHRADYAESRKWAERVRQRWVEGGPAMRRTQDLAVATRHGDVRVRFYFPRKGPCPALVYLHGGGWTLFSIETHDRVMREYAARTGCIVVGIDYALAPEAKYPVALEQVLDVLEWLHAGGGGRDVEAARIAIGGDSAGANLAVAACLALAGRGAASLIRALVLNYGVYDRVISDACCERYGGPEYMLTCEEMEIFWDNYLVDDAQSMDPLVCPLRAELAGLPPAFLAVAECDVLAEQNLGMACRLEEAGVPSEVVVYEGASHSFLEAVSIASLSDRALGEASAWLFATL